MTEKKEKMASTYTLDNFSSTATLTNNADLKGSVATINPEKAYNPFDHREVEHPNSDVGSLIHLLKSSLGSGILAMPMAFKNGGLLVGAIGTFLVGFICTHCVHVLVKCSHELCTRAKIPSMGFAETAGAAFKYGPPKLKPLSNFAKAFVDIGLVLTYFSGNCVYVVFIATSLHQIVEYYSPATEWTPQMIMWILFVPLALLCQIRQLKYLVPFSMLANVLIGISLAISFYYMFRDMQNVSERELATSFQQLPMFFSTVIFAMEGIGVVMPVENTMKKPQHFLGCPGVLNIAMGTVVLLYALVGFIGYMSYGDATKATVTLNLPVEEVLAQVVKVGIALAIFFTYSLQFYVPMDISWTKVVEPRLPQKFHSVAQVLMRVVIVLLTVVVGVLVNDLENLIGLVGAVFFSMLGLLVPAVVETVTYAEFGWGPCNWMLVKNVSLSVLAIVALISGAYSSIRGIIYGDEEHK